MQKIDLSFGINCTEINQSKTSNTFMYDIDIINEIIKIIQYDETAVDGLYTYITELKRTHHRD
jgi:hypothetical protein